MIGIINKTVTTCLRDKQNKTRQNQKKKKKIFLKEINILTV